MKNTNTLSKEFLKSIRNTNFNKMISKEVEKFDKKYDKDLEKVLELNADERETLSIREWKEALIIIKHHL